MLSGLRRTNGREAKTERAQPLFAQRSFDPKSLFHRFTHDSKSTLGRFDQGANANRFMNPRPNLTAADTSTYIPSSCSAQPSSASPSRVSSVLSSTSPHTRRSESRSATPHPHPRSRLQSTSSLLVTCRTVRSRRRSARTS